MLSAESSDPFVLKDLGNKSFSTENYKEAIDYYTKGITALKYGSYVDADELDVNLLCNRAACHLKVGNFQLCVEDCSEALEKRPRSVKAIYRRACAFERLEKLSNSLEDLERLLSIDPNNTQGIETMRRVKLVSIGRKTNETEVTRVLDVLNKSTDSTHQLNSLRILLDLCIDSIYHSTELIRYGGYDSLSGILRQNTENDVLLSNPISLCCMRLLATVCSHKAVVNNYIFLGTGQTDDSIKLSWICEVISNCRCCDLLRPAIMMLMSVLKHTPSSFEIVSHTHKQQIEENIISIDSNVELSLSKEAVQIIGKTLIALLTDVSSDHDTFTIVCETISSFISTIPNFCDQEREIDIRMETIQERRVRMRLQHILSRRSKIHCTELLQLGIIAKLVDYINSDILIISRSASNTLGRFIKCLDDDEEIKRQLIKCMTFLENISGGDERVEDISENESQSIPAMRKRATLEACLLSTHPDLGSWLLRLSGGSSHLTRLVGTNNDRCLEIAAEVICLAAGVDALDKLLQTLLEVGVLQSMINASNAGVRAAAASTLTKLSLKAKALTADSLENAQILNAVISVLKEANRATSKLSKDASITGKQDNIISFSSHDNTSTSSKLVEVKQKNTELGVQDSPHGVSMSPVERSIEVLAALAGKTYIKEEIVHGSYRVSSCIQELLNLQLDPHSSASFGLAHLLSLITVTTRELQAIALAEKELTIEQYEQMQELQRIKARDEKTGETFEEKKEEKDPDTPQLCKLRIRKIVSCDGIKCLVRLLLEGSPQTKLKAAQALRQICVDESSRGFVVQHGAFKLCCEASNDELNASVLRREAAHSIAKCLVTTNPTILSEHMRLGAFRPLLLLCKDVDASPLQQFESLLSITNLLSCGPVEHERFVAERGIHAVHYLMFSQNNMIRRAATEALCNVASHEDVLKVLRVGEKLRLWLGLAEDWTADPEHEREEYYKEAFATARAAAGTIAMAASDENVAQTMISEDIAKTLLHLLNTSNEELVHRAIVTIIELVTGPNKEQAAKHLLTGSIVPSLAVVAKMKTTFLINLAKEAAAALSSAINL